RHCYLFQMAGIEEPGHIYRRAGLWRASGPRYKRGTDGVLVWSHHLLGPRQRSVRDVRVRADAPPWATIGAILALLVLIVDVALMAIGGIDLKVGLLLAGLALARLV